MELFRPEAVAYRRQSRSGELNLAVPLNWHMLGLFCALVFSLGTALALAIKLPRLVRTDGRIEYSEGATGVRAGQSGSVGALLVKEGDFVLAGAPLIIIESDRYDRRGVAESRATLEGLAERAGALELERRAALGQISVDAAKTRGQIASLRAETSELGAQIGFQEQLVAAADLQLREIEEVAARGFISKRDVRARESALTNERLALSRLNAGLAAKRSEITALAFESQKTADRMTAIRAAHQTGRAELALAQFKTSADRQHVVRAPRDGVVTAISVDEWQTVVAGGEILNLVPRQERWSARLLVSPADVGQIDVDMPVRLAVDSYPTARFGFLHGVVTQIARTPVSVDHDNHGDAYFPVEVRLDPSGLSSSGVRVRLKHGMSTKAEMILERRSLFALLGSRLRSLFL